MRPPGAARARPAPAAGHPHYYHHHQPRPCAAGARRPQSQSCTSLRLNGRGYAAHVCFGTRGASESPLDGYALRDAILQKWGKCYDVELKLTEAMGGKTLYLNVSPFSLDEVPFRHESELDYLSHLQAIAELLTEWDRADLVLAEIAASSKAPRRGTIPLLTVPINLRLPPDLVDGFAQSRSQVGPYMSESGAELDEKLARDAAASGDGGALALSAVETALLAACGTTLLGVPIYLLLNRDYGP